MTRKILKDILPGRDKTLSLKGNESSFKETEKIKKEKSEEASKNLASEAAKIPQEELGKIEVVWTAPEYEKIPKPASWYFINIFIFLAILGFALWSKNFFFALFIVLAELILFILGRQEPINFKFRCNNQGLSINNRLYEYEKLEGYSLREKTGGLKKYDELILKKKTAVSPYLKILFDSDKKKELKFLLASKLPEIQYEDTVIDVLFDWVRF